MGGLLAAGAWLLASPAPAQPLRAGGGGLTLVMGAQHGAAVTLGLDARRTKLSAFPLPEEGLRILWTRQLRPTSQPPVVTEGGEVVVVTDLGEALFLNPDGTDAGHVLVGPGPTSAPTLLADGTLIVVNSLGDVVGVTPQKRQVAFRAHVLAAPPPEENASSPVPRPTGRRFGRGRPGHVSIQTVRDPTLGPGGHAWTLPMDDGGVAVALDRALVLLDATGGVRSRARAPVAVASPLVAMDGSVAFASDAGDVYDWDLTDGEVDGGVRRRGSLGASSDGNLAATDGRHLLAVVHGSRLVSFDLRTGVTEPRATASGAFSGPPAVGQDAIYLQEVTVVGTRVLEVTRDGVASPFPTVLSPASSIFLDAGGGATSALTAADAQLFVDPRGRLAYATLDGHVGVITRDAKYELAPLPCGSPTTTSMAPQRSGPVQVRVAPGFAGLVPAGPGAFVVACESGSVAMLAGVK